MDTIPRWFAVIVEGLPDQFEDGVVVAEGLSLDKEYIPELLHYAILVRTANPSEAVARETLRGAVRNLEVSEPLEIILLTDDMRQTVRDERRAVRDMGEGDALVKVSFVGFCKSSPAAKESALKVIRLAILRKPWQFWR